MCLRPDRKSGSASQKIWSPPYFCFRFGLYRARDLSFLPYCGLYCRISSRMASLSPVTAGRPVGEARFVRSTLFPVRTPSHVAYSATPITPSVCSRIMHTAAVQMSRDVFLLFVCVCLGLLLTCNSTTVLPKISYYRTPIGSHISSVKRNR